MKTYKYISSNERREGQYIYMYITSEKTYPISIYTKQNIHTLFSSDDIKLANILNSQKYTFPHQCPRYTYFIC